MKQRLVLLCGVVLPVLVALGMTALVVAAGTRPTDKRDRAALIMEVLRDADNPHVLVAAHRGDWLNHPENSLAGIRSAIEMGCDIIEIDLRLTKDGQFVLMHDKTLDRTTTGTGKVSDHTLAELASLQLRDSTGAVTAESIPTLEQAVALARGRALLYLDKTEDLLDQLHPVLTKLDASAFCLTYGRHTAQELRTRFGPYIGDMNYLPKLGDATAAPKSYVSALMHEVKPAVILVDFRTKDSPIVQQMTEIRATGTRVWASPLWEDIAGGITDTKALTDPDGNWGWLLDQGVSIICTDRPRELIEYLKVRNLRKAELAE